MGNVENKHDLTQEEKYAYLQKTSWPDMKDKEFSKLPAATVYAIDEAYANTKRVEADVEQANAKVDAAPQGNGSVAPSGETTGGEGLPPVGNQGVVGGSSEQAGTEPQVPSDPPPFVPNEGGAEQASEVTSKDSLPDGDEAGDDGETDVPSL